ncbi:hypothetical protein [Streptomyces sp. NPDC001222]|uniref:hypothetical protein n=1 Tax=Streptomyces sp. NPDC001222 TaxID=3364548 RepID=UPI00369DFC21
MTQHVRDIMTSAPVTVEPQASVARDGGEQADGADAVAQHLNLARADRASTGNAPSQSAARSGSMARTPPGCGT